VTFGMSVLVSESGLARSGSAYSRSEVEGVQPSDVAGRDRILT